MEVEGVKGEKNGIHKSPEAAPSPRPGMDEELPTLLLTYIIYNLE